jgi:hypothetical protein
LGQILKEHQRKKKERAFLWLMGNLCQLDGFAILIFFKKKRILFSISNIQTGYP